VLAPQRLTGLKKPGAKLLKLIPDRLAKPAPQAARLFVLPILVPGLDHRFPHALHHIGAETLQILVPQFRGITLVVEKDIATNPEYIGLFSAWAELAASAGQADLIKKTRFLGNSPDDPMTSPP
jgi:hypothetical protein